MKIYKKIPYSLLFNINGFIFNVLHICMFLLYNICINNLQCQESEEISLQSDIIHVSPAGRKFYFSFNCFRMFVPWRNKKKTLKLLMDINSECIFVLVVTNIYCLIIVRMHYNLSIKLQQRYKKIRKDITNYILIKSTQNKFSTEWCISTISLTWNVRLYDNILLQV